MPEIEREEKECKNCAYFEAVATLRGGDEGVCELGERGGITFGRYVCGRHDYRFVTDGSGRLIPGPRSARGDSVGAAREGADRDVRDVHTVNVRRDDKAVRVLGKKGVNYGGE